VLLPSPPPRRCLPCAVNTCAPHCDGILGLKHCQARSSAASAALSPEVEAETIVRGVCATKLPTLTFEDNSRFRGLIGATSLPVLCTAP
jgi:hypothetical protein